MNTSRQNVRGWRTGHLGVPAKGPAVIERGHPGDFPALSRQVDRWALVSTVVILASLLSGLFYVDHLSGYWLGAVVGRLLLAGVVTFVLAACVLGASGPEPKP